MCKCYCTSVGGMYMSVSFFVRQPSSIALPALLRICSQPTDLGGVVDVQSTGPVN